MAWIEKLRSAGTRIEVVPGDVSRRADVGRIFERLAGWGVEPAGVFHAAGTLDDGLLVEMSRARYRKVMAAKVAGTWNLHLATEGLPLDHFVLFSSISAILGSPLQANYAAANAFMDAAAAYRVQRGLSGLSVDWGPWSGAGMAARLATREREAMEKRGLEFLEPTRALGLLEHHLREQSARVAIMAMDWQTLGQALAGLEIPRFLSDLIGEPAPELDGGDAVRARLRELNGLPEDVKQARLVGMVTGHMARVLGVAPDQLPPDVDARESGLDSLMALELRHRVESELGVLIPAGALMDVLSPARVAIILSDLTASGAARATAGEEAEWTEGEI